MAERRIKTMLYNEDCIRGCVKHVADGFVDLIITDPPYGIKGDTLHKHYNRNEEYVLDGYVEVPEKEYADFSRRWIKQAERILRPGGSIYIVSGYTNLIHILNALRKTSLREVNHIIWKYNFGVYTKTKYVSSHYHILFYEKPGGKRTFNLYSRYERDERDGSEGSLNYADREDVWVINREYKPRRIKNKNQLPATLLVKLIQYSSNEGDVVCDLFLGSCSTAVAAVGMNRHALGFELSKEAFEHYAGSVAEVVPGELLKVLKRPPSHPEGNHGRRWEKDELERLAERYEELYRVLGNKTQVIDALADEFGRGRFGVLNALKK